MSHFNAFIDMGGYGKYVWSAYSISLGIIFWSIYRAIKYKYKVLREIQENNENSS